MSTSSTSSSQSPPMPMTRPASHSFSLQRPVLSLDAKKTRNSKRLSLLVPPSPGKLETLASIAAVSTPSFPPSTSSFASRRRHFTSAPLSTSLSPIQSQSPTADETTTDAETAECSSRRHSQLMLDQALPTPRLPLSLHQTNNSNGAQRPISAYFADFSAECGTASPYTKAPVQVLPHLYLGAEHNATDIKSLSRLGITAVLNVAVEIASQTSGDRIVKTMQGRSIHYKNLSWTHHQRNLQSEFPLAFAFIEDIKSQGGKVLIHCQLGVSRSASLVIAYVMKTCQMNLTDAYEFVKARSSVISPNMSLMYQLSEFGKSLTVATTTQAPSKTNSSHSSSSYWASMRDDDEDDYPYPVESNMDVDVEMEEQDMRTNVPVALTLPTSRSASKRNSLSLAPATTRPRSPYSRTLLAPLSLTGEASNMMPPKTPMTDRFSFPEVPATPMTDRFSFSEMMNTPPRRFPEGEFLSHPQNESASTSKPFVLSPPVAPFALSHKPTSSSSSMSSFTSSASYSRPSSTSSVSSTALSISEPATPPLPVVSDTIAVVTPIASEFTKHSNISYNNNRNSGLWSMLPTTPTRTAPSSSLSSTSAAAVLSGQAPAGKPRPAAIHTLAKALTRRWSNGFHGCQQQPPPSPSVQMNGIECLLSSASSASSSMDGMVMSEVNGSSVVAADCVDEAAAEKKEEGSPAQPESIFSPRPCSPPLLETKTYGEFYQALRMEG